MKKSFLFLSLLFILIAANACSKAEAKGVFSSGQITIHSTASCDLDQGVETGDPDRDFKWANGPPTFLQSKNGGKFFLVGTISLDSLEYEALTGYTYSTDTIQSSQLPVGTVVAVITNQGRYSKFRIDAKSADLTITWITYVI